MKSKFLLFSNVVLIIIVAILAFLFWSKSTELSQALEYTEIIKKNYQNNYDILLEKYNQEKSTPAKANVIELSQTHIRRLAKKGLENPVQDLVDDLIKHPELIPEKGTLGGTMGFNFEDKIWILTNKWVLAYYEDGHKGGYVLLQYDVSSVGKITWKKIASHSA